MSYLYLLPNIYTADKTTDDYLVTGSAMPMPQECHYNGTAMPQVWHNFATTVAKASA
ncbi:hypothetical protein GCM10007084_17320 [Parabacteroides faecis]|nr:hypothetical protein GCM10007084_17320 [Parabacteroides faecis]